MVDDDYYVEEVQTTNLPEVRTAYVVVNRTETGYGDSFETSEIDYSDGDWLYYDSPEEAAAKARTLALQDWRDALWVPEDVAPHDQSAWA